jgi:site-specific recombinase XerC
MSWGDQKDVLFTDKGGKTRDIPLPSVVMKFLQSHVDLVVAPEVGEVAGDTPLFWSRWAGRRGARRVMPIHGKNLWRPCQTHGRLIGVPELKPHDLRHGVAMEVLEQHHDCIPDPRRRPEVSEVRTEGILLNVHPGLPQRG